MSKGKAALVAGAVVVLGVPMAVMGAGGGDEAKAATVSTSLNATFVPMLYREWIDKAAATCPAITAPVIAAQIEAESAWDPAAVSPVGARGLSQFMPDTWRTWGVNTAPETRTAADPFNPADAIMTQAKYDCALADQMSRLIADHEASGDLLSLTLAAYNAGPGAVKQYHGIPPYPETQQYVQAIKTGMAKYTASSPTGSTSAFGAAVVEAALRWQGTPYSWGGGDINGPTLGVGRGASTNGFDCSGLTLYAVYQASGGKTLLPHSSEIQATMGTEQTMTTIQPGDLIAVQTEPGDYSHVVIYQGNGMIVEAPRTGLAVRSVPLSEYAGKVQTIRRIG
ncbi:NlpC/P60 family protein [Kitasatospora sp. NPDC087861]|uniref:NlpC/P60 family protein n=1 Tax=Kitasatospora sp. NPDC087861 TaxID=3364070 RepID=UPI00382C8ED7